MNSLITFIGILGTLAEAILYFILAARLKVRREFPSFTIYIGILACSDLFLYYVRSELGPEEYFWCWWAQCAVLSAAKIFVVVEVFLNLFEPLWTVPKGPLHTLLAAIMILGIIILFTGIHSPSTYPASYLRFLRTAAKSVDLFTSICMWFVVLFASYFGMPWRRKCCGIAVGLCVELTSASVLSVIRAAENHRFVHDLLAPIEMMICVIALAVWISYFARRDKDSVKISSEAIERIHIIVESQRTTVNRALFAGRGGNF